MNIIQDPQKLPTLTLVKQYQQVSLKPTPSDLASILESVKAPTLFILMKTGKICGGYASQPWQPNSKFGDDRCFLFSLEQDLRLVPNPANKGMNLWMQLDGLGWGRTDLIMKDNGEWFSALGADYRLVNGTLNEKSLISGGSSFMPDVLEIWKVQHV